MKEKENLISLDENFFDEDEDTQKDKYFTFHLANEDYGIEIKYVLEIIVIQKITKVPGVPDFIKGVINLRGKVIPVMDVRARFHLPARDYDERTCIIIVDINEISVGLVVDEVREVIVIPEHQVEPPPVARESTTGRYIQGIGKVNDEIEIILNVKNLLFDNELTQ